MKHAITVGVAIVGMALALTGCDKQGAVDKKINGKKNEHVHGKGPNGGVVFDFGALHAEFTVDHGKKECTLFILGEDETRPTPIAAKDLILTTKETKTKEGKVVAPMTIKLSPKDESGGKAAKFVGADPGLVNVADFEGIVTGVIDGKPAQVSFKEE